MPLPRFVAYWHDVYTSPELTWSTVGIPEKVLYPAANLLVFGLSVRWAGPALKDAFTILPKSGLVGALGFSRIKDLVAQLVGIALLVLLFASIPRTVAGYIGSANAASEQVGEF